MDKRTVVEKFFPMLHNSRHQNGHKIDRAREFGLRRDSVFLRESLQREGEKCFGRVFAQELQKFIRRKRVFEYSSGIH